MQKIHGMVKGLNMGKVLVVNEAGGYTFWDDRCMQMVDEVQDERAVAPRAEICKSKVLVLENQESISDQVKVFMKELFPEYDSMMYISHAPFSSVTQLRYAEEGETERLIKLAIKNGCDTIVCETTATNQRQLEAFAHLFKTLPKFNFYIFTNSDLKQEIEKIVGSELCERLFAKHNIVIK